MGSQKSKKSVAFLLFVTMLIQTCLIGVTAADEEADASAVVIQENGASVASSSTGSASEPAAVEDGEIYALQNVGSGLWASTTVNSGTYFYMWNAFQHSVWNNSAQTFRFVKTDSGENTYIIYPLEYNNYNTNETRALYCNYNSISVNQADTVNVTYANYSASNAASFEWIVEKQDGYVNTIRLKADPRYILSVGGNAAGSESPSGEGNMMASRQASATATPTLYQQWNIRYVLDEGDYYIKNRYWDMYCNWDGSNLEYLTIMHYYDLYDPDLFVWRLEHIQNGEYYIVTYTSSSTVLYLSGVSAGSGVYIGPNHYQNNTRWLLDRCEGKSFQIRNKSTSSGNLRLMVSNEYEVVENDNYETQTNSIDQWYFVPMSSIYGTRTFWDTDKNLDSLSYALQGSGTARYLMNISDTFWTYQCQVEQQIIYNLNGIENILREEICNMLIQDIKVYSNVTSIVRETGDHTAELEMNQYRIAIRIGTSIEYYYDLYKPVLCYGVHAWYQTYDGTWAHTTESGDPEYLNKGSHPSDYVLNSGLFSFRESSGYVLSFSNLNNFYNSPVYYFIITQNVI